MYDQRVQDLVDNLGVKIKYSGKIEVGGTYIASLNWIIINSNLREMDQYEVLLHELGHACQHRDCFELYNTTLNNHLKCECEADTFMIEELVEKYMSVNNIDIEQINYVNFIVDNDLSTSYIPMLQKILQSKIKRKGMYA